MLIDVQDIQRVRPVSDNIDIDRILPYIDEAEKLYVIPVLGPSLYKKIDRDKEKYADLMMGAYYDNETKYCAGLTAAVSYLAYAKFVVNHSASVTPFGVLSKIGEMSSPISAGGIASMAKDAEKTGLEYLRQCVDYIKFLYPESQTSTPGNVKFIAIG